MKRRFAGLVSVCFGLAIALNAGGVAAGETNSPSAAGETSSSTSCIASNFFRVAARRNLQDVQQLRPHAAETTTVSRASIRSSAKKTATASWPKWKAPAASSECTSRIPNTAFPAFWDRKGEHIRIYLDGEKKPALDVPLEDIFYGKLEGFPKPVADVALGGLLLLRADPLPEELQGRGRRDGRASSCRSSIARFPSDKGIVTFRNPPSEPQRKALAKAVKAWTSCGDLSLHAGRGPVEQGREDLRLEGRRVARLDAAARVRRWSGPCALKIKPEQVENANGARLQITWDGAKSPAVDLPLDYFYLPGEKAHPVPLAVGRKQRRGSGTTSCRCPIASRARSRSRPRSRSKGR